MTEINNVEIQIQIFLIFILVGASIAILFDLFKSIRKNFKTPDIITYVEDFFFWVITGVILIYSIIIFNNGQIRGFIFFGIFIGALLYSLTISNFFVIIFTNLIKFVKILVKLLIKCLIYPINFFKKPIIIVFFNLKNFKEKSKKKLNKETFKKEMQ